MKGDKSLHWMECSAWPVFFMPIRHPPLVSSHMSPAFWPPLLTANKLATTSSKSLLKWNILHLPFQVHIEGVSYNCDICGKTSGSKNGLQQHKAKYHRYLKLFEHPPPLLITPSWLIVFNRNVTYTSQSTVVPIMSGDWFPILSQSFTINQPLNYQPNYIRLSLIFRPWPHAKYHSQHHLPLKKTENFCRLIHIFIRACSGNYVTAALNSRTIKTSEARGGKFSEKQEPGETLLIQPSRSSLPPPILTWW